MLRQLNKVHPRVLLTYVLVSLVILVVRAVIAQNGRLYSFTNTLTVIGLILTVAGIFYAMDLRGEYNLFGWTNLTNRLRKQKDGTQRFQEFREAMTETENAHFNYPLFLGILYLIVSAVIAYGFL